MSKLKFSLVFICGFVVYYFFDAIAFQKIQQYVTDFSGTRFIGHVMAYAITVIPLVIAVSMLGQREQNVFAKMGLSKPILPAVIFVLLVTLPMLIGFAIKHTINDTLSVNTIIINTISSAFFEELIFRAFLFGALYRFTKLGFIPSVLLGAILFGLLHLYQASSLADLVGIFLITFLGSILFSWLYAEWGFNLWIPILLHCFINLYWLIFNVDESALGTTHANIFRVVSIVLAIAGTIMYKRKKSVGLEINKRTWLLK